MTGLLVVALVCIWVLIGTVFVLLRSMLHQRKVIAWCDEREVLFGAILRDMTVLHGGNFYHPLPGEWEVNFETLRKMWASVAAQESARGAVFKEFRANFERLEKWEKSHPVPTIRWKPW